MQFRVLGSVEAVSAQGTVDIGEPRCRCVLAVLLVEANRFVSTGQLIDRVWGERPPRDRNALYSHVSRLRAIFSAEPDVGIQRRSGGYQLMVDADAVDLHRFRALVDQARSADEDAVVVRLLDEALALWRGTPFADLDKPWLATMRSALELERQAAQADRADAALRCGWHGHVLAELSVRARQQPLDERVAGQLMRALAGAGRPADALSVYQRTRSALVDQLGVEPSVQLRRIHESVLAADADPVNLRAVERPRQETLPAAVTPFQLPADTARFTGRVDDLAILLDLLSAPEHAGGSGAPRTVVVTAIEGMAGIGKTALAVHAAHHLADHFPDGVLFADLQGFTPGSEPTEPEQALEHLLRGLGVPGPQIPPDLETRVGLYRSVLARRRVLVVLDNAVHETQLAPLLPATASCAAIVTSRRHLAGLDEATHLTLSVLDLAEAAALFRSLVGGRALLADHVAIERIVTLCGQLPLAIRIAAARFRLAPVSTVATLCTELEQALDTRSGLDWLADGHRTITAALDVSYRHLTADQQHALLLAGLHPGPSVEPYAMAALADTTVETARRVLEDLYAANLLHQPAHRRYTLHDLVTAYVAPLAADIPQPDQVAAVDRLYEYYAAASARAMKLTRPQGTSESPRLPSSHIPIPTLHNQEQAKAWLDNETDNIAAMAYHFAAHHRAVRADNAPCLGPLHSLLPSRGTGSSVTFLLGAATSKQEAEWQALVARGRMYLAHGRFESASDCYEEALASARRNDIARLQQAALHQLGRIYLLRGRYELATEYFEKYQDNARQEGNRTAETLALLDLGQVRHLQGQYETATDCYEKALADAMKTGFPIGQFEAHQGLGRVHRAIGHHREALSHYNSALQLALRRNRLIDQARAHDGLAHTHFVQKDTNHARHHWRTALRLLTDLGLERTEEPDVTTAAIRIRLHDLDNLSTSE